MELETNNLVTSNARVKTFRTKTLLTQPQININNAFHNYTKQIKFLNRTNSSSTNATTSTTVMPIKGNHTDGNAILNNQNNSKTKLNRIDANINLSQNKHNNPASISSTIQLNDGNKLSSSLLTICTSPLNNSTIKMNSNFIYPVSHQQRLMNNISSFSDQTNMASTQVKSNNLVENNETKILKLRSQTSQLSAKDNSISSNQYNNHHAIGVQKNKKMVKLKPLLKTNSLKLVNNNNSSNLKANVNSFQTPYDINDVNKLQYIALHKPLKPLKPTNLLNIKEDIRQSVHNNLHFLKDNKLTLFDTNKLILSHKKTSILNNEQNTNSFNFTNNNNFYKWSFSNNESHNNSYTVPSIKASNILTTEINRTIFNDTITNSLKMNDMINKTKPVYNKKNNNIKHQLDDIDEDYMDNMYTKSVLEKIDVNSDSNNTCTSSHKNKESDDTSSYKNQDTYDVNDSDNDTLVSSSSLLSTSDKSCEIIYRDSTNIIQTRNHSNHRINQENRKIRLTKKLNSQNKQQSSLKPEELFLNNEISSSDNEEEFFIQKNVNVIKNVKKNILTNLNKQLSANSKYE